MLPVFPSLSFLVVCKTSSFFKKNKKKEMPCLLKKVGGGGYLVGVSNVRNYLYSLKREMDGRKCK